MIPVSMISQSLSGVVSGDGSPVVGATVMVKSTNNGTSTDVDGKYQLTLEAGTYTVSFSSVGYKTKNVKVTIGDGDTRLNVDLSVEAHQLGDVVILGSRTQERTVVDSPLPIDIFSFKEVTTAGQTSFDKLLQYRVPSFSTVQTPVNDASALIDPWEIRNMGISRTLILINGKRKNLSALVYTQTSPSRGEAGVDISAIAPEAIKRIEVLRDGASAQYGSDAIAGVVNIVLKDEVNEGRIAVTSGMTGEGDGRLIGVSLNNGSAIGDNAGFVNYTVDFSRVGEARRSGEVDAEADADGNTGFGADLAFVKDFLKWDKTAGNRNSSPATAASKFVINAGFNLSPNTSLYANAAYVYKKVNSFANYRTPYWRTLSSFPYLKDFFSLSDGTYRGYVPTFDGDLIDNNATLGVKTKKDGWNIDASFTTGFNSIDYTVTESHNRSKNDTGGFVYGAASPTTFKPGGTTFSHMVGNLDISKAINSEFNIAFGTEFRSEDFTILPGDKASYEGVGADSYAGNRPENSGAFNRFNFGGYFDVGYDVSKTLLLAATIRSEYFSDFGNAFVYKFSSRFKPFDEVTVRGSYSTGFKAPTLHQIYTQRAQYSFAAGGAIQIVGLINNVSPQAKILGVKKLTPEKSKNLTVGFGLEISTDMNLTVDYYDIAVEDRIVISNRVATASGEAEFFTNSIDTKTSGVDVVYSYQNIDLGSGILGLSISGNVNLVNERVGDIPKVKGTPVIDFTQEALFFTSRPKQKIIFGTSYEMGNINLMLNNTYFGSTEFRQAGMSADLKTVFEAKVVSDINISYAVDDNLTFNVSLNNILDVTPKWNFEAMNAAGTDLLANAVKTKEQSNLITFNQRYAMMTYDGFHFSQLGRMFNLGFTYSFN